ncbi:AbrB/MazE/SpoVT family DNA-binding domain-containing protein [Magnetococcales bacterium HHB-1]
MTMTTATTMTEKGQITIPKAIRNLLHLKPGDKVEFEAKENGEVLVKPKSLSVDDIFGMLRDPKKPTLTTEEIEDVITQQGNKSQ